MTIAWRTVRCFSAIAFALGVVSLPAQARLPRPQVIWMVQPGDAPKEPLVLVGGNLFLKQRLLPTGLAELRTTVAIEVADVVLPAGAQLVEVTTVGEKIFCVARLAKKNMVGRSQLCLVDRNSDHVFDAYLKTESQTQGLLTLNRYNPKKRDLASLIPYAVVDPKTMTDEFFVAVEALNFKNIYGTSSSAFGIAFGRDAEVARLTDTVSMKSTDLPRQLTMLGSRFTAISTSGDRVTVSVEAPIPPQPFGIVSTTTITFY